MNVNLFSDDFENQRNILTILLDERIIDIDAAVDQLAGDFAGLSPVDALDLLTPVDMVEAIAEFESAAA